MRVLVTGCAGFVGSNLTRRLLNDGHDVIGIDSLTDYYSPTLKKRALARLPHFTHLREDINEYPLEQLGKVDWIFHQAGQPGVRKSWGSDFSTYIEANIAATQRLLEWATTRGVRRFVYASSSSVYGDAETYPTLETQRPLPVSPYGVTKLAAEHLATLYAKNFGLPTTSLRYFTVYGPGQRPDMAFTRFLNAALTGDEIRIFGDGEQLRDFTYIDDVVDANVRAAATESDPGSVYNVAGGSNVSVNEVLAIIQELAGRELNVRYLDQVPGDVRRTSGSTAKIQSELGWEPKVSLREGLSRQFDWVRTSSDVIS